MIKYQTGYVKVTGGDKTPGNPRLAVTFDIRTLAKLNKIAASRNMRVSHLVRLYVSQGLSDKS